MFEAVTAGGLMFEPVLIEFIRDDEGTAHISTKPLVALFGDRVVRILEDANPRLTPRALGYRLVERRPELRAGIYARPWPLWAVLRLRRRMLDKWWGIGDWLCHHGIIHFRTPEAMYIRWRDLGLGPDPKRR